MSDGWVTTNVVDSARRTDGILSLFVRPPTGMPHHAGQHYELRTPGESVSRKYSVVSSPLKTDALEFGIKLYQSGAISPKLWSLLPGDAIELRGPLGTSFIWTPDMTGPLVLIGAGSGIAPLIAIHDHFKAVYPMERSIFIASAKSANEILHYKQLQQEIIPVMTASEPRIDHEFLLRLVGALPNRDAGRYYVCGPCDFTDDVIDYLLGMNIPTEQIRSESY